MRIEAREIVVVRKGRRILDGASIAVEAGEIACIEGASGSGKSTLLRVMATLLEMDSGALLLDGRDAREIEPRAYRRRVAYVLQQPPMLEGTVAVNVETGPRLRGEVLGRARVVEILDHVGLDPSFVDRPARELSGGERQRLAFARALANAPEVMLLDEPTSALDPASAARILELTRRLASEGLSVVVVTHHEDHARALAGTAYRCEHGRVARCTP